MENQTPTRKSPSNKWLVFGSTICALLVVEIALRLGGYSYPIFYTTDPDCGYVLRPGVEGWYHREGNTYVRINKEGLRDREHSLVKPPDTVRIAVLGDSYAEAMQVPLEDTFWAVMEKELQQCGTFAGKQVEVINFGVGGYGTAQELITLRHRAWDYSPDIILLAVTTSNDVSDNSRDFKRNPPTPYFVYRDGRMTLDASFRETPAFRIGNSALNRWGRAIRDHLRILQAIHEAHYVIKGMLSSRRNKGGVAQAVPLAAPDPSSPAGQKASSGSGVLGLEEMAYQEPDSPVWKEAWRVTEGLIVLMRDEVKQHGAKFAVVTLSNPIQVYPDAGLRRSFARRLGVNDLLYPDLRIKDLCERQGIPVYNLAPDLRRIAEHGKVFLHGTAGMRGLDGHWNKAGHHAAGELIAQKLCGGLLK
ncbi:MAG: SGNH/GDSL hydrolase family protein [Acidobacteriia bacterium]|nr:SGNH/GDSL hydrolase family protein [Terriglobia bacterium]